MKYIVFDFDGTIADTFTVVEEIGNSILQRYGIKINSEEAKQIGLRQTIIKSKFPKWEIPKVLSDLRKQLNRRIAEEVKLFPGMESVLIELKKRYDLGIVSSNSGENIQLFLSRNGVLDLFSFIHSDSSLFGKHIVLKRLCRANKIKFTEIVYIGDEDRDVQAANRLGIPIIAVTWGYNTGDNLIKEKPTFIVDNSREILEYILKLK
jgi:HAD superfamily hydrolase (TIGR01549 family)